MIALPHPVHVQHPELAARDELEEQMRTVVSEIRSYRRLRHRYPHDPRLCLRMEESEAVSRRAYHRMNRVRRLLQGHHA